jgi:hypothetical protein
VAVGNTRLLLQAATTIHLHAIQHYSAVAVERLPGAPSAPKPRREKQVKSVGNQIGAKLDTAGGSQRKQILGRATDARARPEDALCTARVREHTGQYVSTWKWYIDNRMDVNYICVIWT